MKKNNYIQRIKNLLPKQRELLASQLTGQDAAPQNTGRQRIVAYVTSENNFEKNGLTGYLKERLPDYMVPANIVCIAEMPRLPNGKIDQNNLPKADEKQAGAETGFAAPGTEVEQKLAAIWEEVLHFEPVSIHDNFFEIGGDSILSIQIVARARKAGIQLKPTDIFEHQSIAELALFAKTETDKQPAEKEIFSGPVALLPIQHWFFDEHKNAPQYWNQGFVFQADKIINEEVLKKAVQHLTLVHESLRLSFFYKNNKWEAEVLPPEKSNPFFKINISNKTETEQKELIKEHIAAVQTAFNLSEGDLFKTIFFENNKEGRNLIYIIAHHLLVDYVSWQIIIDDLELFYENILAGEKIKLPENNISINKWGSYLNKLAGTDKIKKELVFWEEQSQTALPMDFDMPLPVLEKDVQNTGFQLDKALTAALLNDAANAYNTKTDELLTAALAKTICGWSKKESICIGLERHGRDVFLDEIDVSNLVGWLTVYFPLLFDFNKKENIGEAIKYVKEKIRKVPNGGVGYGLLRYFNEIKKLEQRPPVIFNYLGQKSVQKNNFFGKKEALMEGMRAAKSERYHLLEINAFISEGQLEVACGYAKNIYKKETIEKLMADYKNNLRTYIEHCAGQKSDTYTPSDFPEAELSQDDLDSLLGSLNF